MLEFKQGNLLEENAEALINTVNCVGVMGKGIALQFKQAFPENFKQYKRACDAGEVQPGRMLTIATGNLLNPRYIINFPTKRHWKGKSKLEDIKSGLKALVEEVQRLGIQSIAIPPLGCGNGGLDWAIVKPLILDAFANLSNVRVILFEPGGTPSADQVRIGTQPPDMTRARALLVSVMDQYVLPGYRLGRLEVQKLAYFLQEVGEPLRLRYEKHLYGPYADNLNHVLQRLDGHFIRGFGDRSKQSQMYVLPEGRQAAQGFLDADPEVQKRLQQVSQLIEGFETPYGMEMLATVHWVARYENPVAAEDIEAAIAGVQAWSDRKRNLFKPQHLRKAWQRLHDQGWLTE